MKTKLKSAIVGTAMIAAVGGVVLAGGGTASALGTPPPWVPPNATGAAVDANAVGGLEFFDAGGNQITGGNISDSPIAKYVVGTTQLRAGDTTATLFGYTPNPANVQGNFPGGEAFGTSTVYPVSGAPAPVGATALPVETGNSGDESLAIYMSDFAQNSSATGYANTFELRLKTAGPGLSATLSYDYADITVTGTTWAVSYTPAPPAGTVSTTTTIDSSTPTSVGAGANITLKADVSATSGTPSGTVQFFNNTTAIGAPVAVSAGSASLSTSFATAGTVQLKATYTPGALTSFLTSSTASAYPITVTAVPTPTVTLGLGGGYLVAGSDATLTATVSPGTAAGSVAFFDGTSTTPIPGTATNPSAGVYDLDVTAGFAAGSHSIVAKFTSSAPASFQNAQSAPQAFITQAPQVGACAQPGSVCSENQAIEATVPVGTLVINTPYNTQNYLNLGTLVLSPDSTKFSASTDFNNIVVTDARAGNLSWTVAALAGPLSDGGSNTNSTINAENVGLTTIQATPGAGFVGHITPTDNPAANGVSPTDTGSLGLGGGVFHTVAVADHGEGTVTMKGTITLNAPSSTEAGLFTGTITFTVS